VFFKSENAKLKKRITELEAALAERDKTSAKLMARIAELEAKIIELTKNSRNSSKPPSSDGPDIQRSRSKRSKKKRGGQPGHERHERKLIPQEQVNEIIPIKPLECRGCGLALSGNDKEPIRHQVIEIPPITPHITEYQLHELYCKNCQTNTRAPLPMDVPRGSFGPRLCAMIAVLTAKYRLSKRAARECMSDFLGVIVALGSIAKIEQQVSKVLEEPYAAAILYVQDSSVVNADETSWRENKQKAWLWVTATKLVSVFVIARSRGAAVAKQMLSETYCGIVITDRWGAYHWLKTKLRQLCWSHLIRDFRSWIDRGGVGKKLGKAILKGAALLRRRSSLD